MRERTKINGKWALVLMCVWIAGCAGHQALKSDLTEYDEAYGDANNIQMLLNLARLANNDPVQFLQIGSFSAQHNYMVGAGFNPTYTHNSPFFYGGGSSSSSTAEFLKNVLMLQGSVTASVSETPIFQFLPLTGTNLVETVLAPIPEKIFYTLYDQGFHADLLARTMVASVRHAAAITNALPIPGNDTPNVVTNVADGATNYITTRYEYWVNNPDDPTYPKFLAYCNNLRKAQYYQLLAVDGKPGEIHYLYSGYAGTNAGLTDVVAAVQANLKVSEQTNSKYMLVSQATNSTGLVRVTNSLPIVFRSPLADRELNIVPTNFHGISSDNSFIAEYIPAESPTLSTEYFAGVTYFAAQSPTNNTLKMRTVESAMYAAAQEERKFRALESLPPDTNGQYPYVVFSNDCYGPYAFVTTTNRAFPYITNLTITDPDAILRKAGDWSHDPIVAKIVFDITNGGTNVLSRISVASGGVQIVITNLDLIRLSIDFPTNNATNLIRDIHFLENGNVDVPTTYGFNLEAAFPGAVYGRNLRQFVVRPLMKLTCPPGEKPFDHVLAQIPYGDRVLPWGPNARVPDTNSVPYMVGDYAGQNQDRGVFSLLSYLFAQAAISTQNLPVQQLIQVP
jgi:hypothetical protein